MAMLSEEEQLARDEELARQLQQQEFHNLVPNLPRRHSTGTSQNQDINAPLLNNDGNANQANVANGEPQGQQQDQLRRNVIDSVRDADTESPRILLARVTIGLIELIATTTVLSIGWSESCGQPLKWWVLAYSARHFIALPLRIYIFRLRRTDRRELFEKSIQVLRWINILSFLWFLVGQSFLFTGKHCEQSAPTVWYYCLVIIVLVYVSLALPFLIVLAICICLPCVLIVFRFFAEPEGAGTEVIKNLPTRKIKEEDVETGGKEDEDNNERQACAICIQDYEPGDEVRVLPCGHEFHKSCVDKWLPMKKICPLCRHDITKKPPSTASPSRQPSQAVSDEQRDVEEPNSNLLNNDIPAVEGETLERA